MSNVYCNVENEFLEEGQYFTFGDLEVHVLAEGAGHTTDGWVVSWTGSGAERTEVAVRRPYIEKPAVDVPDREGAPE